MENSRNRDILNKETMFDTATSIPRLKTRHLPVTLHSIYSFFVGHTTPARLLNDLAMADLMPNLVGSIVEIGASKSVNHKRFSNPCNEYILSNISKEEGFIYLDAMDMSLSNDSVNNFVSVATLEHMPNP